VIDELADELDAECAEWATIESDDDYDRELLEVVTANTDALATLQEALLSVEGLLALPIARQALKESLNRCCSRT